MATPCGGGCGGRCGGRIRWARGGGRRQRARGTIARHQHPPPGEPVLSAEQADKLATAAALAEIANALPAPKPKPVIPAKTPEPAQTPITLPSFPMSALDAAGSANLMPSPERLARLDSGLTSWSAPMPRPGSSGSSAATESTPQTPSAPTAAPVDDTASGKTSHGWPDRFGCHDEFETNTATPALPPSIDGAAAPQASWPASAEAAANQRIAEAWRGTPVRGPPPGVASALGNDGRTTIYQVSVVDGQDGFEVSISTQQMAAVTNAGVRGAGATAQGSATSTGDLARTSIYQVSVVVASGNRNRERRAERMC